MQSNWTIPGTTLEGLRSNADRTEGLFQSLNEISPNNINYRMPILYQSHLVFPFCGLGKK